MSLFLPTTFKQFLKNVPEDGLEAILDYNQYVAIQAGATLCGVGIKWHQGFLAEIFTTYFLVQTVLVAAVDQGSMLAPLAIGFIVITDIIAAGSISGASMNPARSLGPNIVGSVFMSGKLADRFWSQHWIYYLGPAVGAVAAAGVYRYGAPRNMLFAIASLSAEWNYGKRDRLGMNR
ncbi:aquaporin AqpM domain protein [Oesophagostomum dentatum]|uniref:Aquaporin AqpM domain protein n=1 Tax=Oesophagostomum dentatum TaxID=61180 RepID=A0A0B1SSD4_OESDE|nr:aquaporin AqpM domain protein [Oesophagostomum dentatum]